MTENTKIDMLEEFAETIQSLAGICYRISSDHGFHEDHETVRGYIHNTDAANAPGNASVLEWLEATALQAEIARMHSELSEALESVRKPKPDDHLPQFDNVVVELADCIIRILDTCGKRGWPIGQAIIEKMEYNMSRPYKHGKNS